MEGLVDAFSEPWFVAIFTGLLVVLAACAFFYFGRSAKARKAYQETADRERDLRRQFDAVVSSARDGVIVTMETLEVAMISDVAARMLGVRREDVLGRALGRLPVQVVDGSGNEISPHE